MSHQYHMHNSLTGAHLLVPDTTQQVDPWKLQASIMQLSGQNIPPHMEFNKDSLMYMALILEEVGELCTAVTRMTDTMVMPYEESATDILAKSFIERTMRMRDGLRQTGMGLKMQSQMLRQYLGNANNPVLEFGLPDRLAVLEMLDGITDVMVVAAGFCVATGLPGADAFLEVNTSNHSKTNPETGVIDKDPSGKWIKGPKYREPNLDNFVNWTGRNIAYERAQRKQHPGTACMSDFGAEDELHNTVHTDAPPVTGTQVQQDVDSDPASW